jgi:poly(A) polymerase
MGTLLHETPVATAAAIVERLKFSRAEAHHMVALVANIPQFLRIREMPLSELKRFFRLPDFNDHLELARICATASGGDIANYNFADSAYHGLTAEEIAPPPLITGVDLIRMGFTPGPVFTVILTRVEDEQLEGRLQTRDDAIAFVLRHYGDQKK